MKLWHHLSVLTACVFLTGCFGAASGPRNSEIPTAKTTDVLRVGDKITVRLTGVPGDSGYIVEIQIPENGDINVSYLSQSFHAAGRTAADLAADITQAYRTNKIYASPQVTVLPEERFVSVGGDVRGPTRVMYTPDLTLLSAINACGGFTDYAKRNAVRILRGTQVIYVNAAAAAAGTAPDPQLFPGDQITVQRTIF